MDKIKELYFKYKEVINYLIFGVLTTVVSITVFYVFNKPLGLNEHVANIISWLCAVLFAYITNKLFVFESKTADRKELIKEIISFYGARLLTLGIEEAILFIGVSLLKIDSMFVKVAAQFIVIVANYVLSKLFIFKGKK